MEKTNPPNETPAVNPESVPPGENRAVKPPAPAKPASRAGRILRNILYAVLGGLVLFLAGLLVAYLVFTRPVQAELKAVSASLAELEGESEQMEASLKELQETRTGLEAEKKDLQTTLASSDLHIAILNTLADVMSARQALVDKNNTGASLALANAGNSLKTLESLAPEDQQVVVAALQKDLESVVSALPGSPTAAQNELALMTENLKQLRDTYFRQQ